MFGKLLSDSEHKEGLELSGIHKNWIVPIPCKSGLATDD